MLRHALTVAGVAILLVIVIMYCITPDLINNAVTHSRYRAGDVMGSTALTDLLPVTGGHVNTIGLGILLLSALFLAGWTMRKLKFGKQEKMAACLAKAVRQMGTDPNDL